MLNMASNNAVDVVDHLKIICKMIAIFYQMAQHLDLHATPMHLNNVAYKKNHS